MTRKKINSRLKYIYIYKYHGCIQGEVFRSYPPSRNRNVEDRHCQIRYNIGNCRPEISTFLYDFVSFSFRGPPPPRECTRQHVHPPCTVTQLVRKTLSNHVMHVNRIFFGGWSKYKIYHQNFLFTYTLLAIVICVKQFFCRY